MTDLYRLSATEIARAVRGGTLSAVDVTEAHLSRMDAVNPALNAVVAECRDEALAAAREIDAAIAGGEDPGPLAGVPVTIKVNVDQAGFATTNGLKLQRDLIAAQDSPVVANIRKAGGVVVGRTNTPAFSLRWFTRNDLHGQTMNPRDRALTPGGSSGGAGAAVAAGLCAVGHGTDIAGSVRYPAYACGVHGLRPTLGRIPAWNATGADRFIGAQIMAVSGPLARTVEDIGLSLRAMAAPDARDPWSMPVPLEPRPFARRAALAVAPDGMETAPAVAEALRVAAAALEATGWTVEEVPCPPMRPAARINATLWMAETQAAAAALIAREDEPDSRFVFEMMCRDTGAIDLDAVMRALQARAGLVRDWELFFGTYPLLLCPVSAELPFEQQLDVRSEADFFRVYEAQLTQRALPVMGMPALSVATGTAEGRPVGVQLVSGRFREDILLDAGATVEAASGVPQVADPA